MLVESDGSDRHMVQVATDVEVLYEEFFPILVRIGVRDRGLARADAEAVAQDVFIEFLGRLATVENRKAYLAGAMYHAAAHFRRRHGRITYGLELDRIGDDETTALHRAMTTQALAKLTKRCAGALRLRFIEGHSVPELAKILRTSVKYAEKVVRECLQQARRRNGEAA